MNISNLVAIDGKTISKRKTAVRKPRKTKFHRVATECGFTWYLTGVKDEDGEEVGVIDQFNNWNNSYGSINFMIDDKNIYDKLLTHVYKFKP